MVKKTILLFILLLVFPIVSAGTLDLSLKTLPEHNVIINLGKPTDRYELIIDENLPLKKKSDGEGMVSFTYFTEKYNQLKIFVQVNKDGEKVLFQNFGIKKLSEPQYFLLTESEVRDDYTELAEDEEEVNETEEQNQTEEVVPVEEEIVEETTEEDQEPGITGSAISDTSSWLFSRTTMWIVGIAIVVAIVVVFIVRKSLSGPKIDLPKVQNIKSLPEMPKPATPIDEELLKTEQEIENVRSRIERIKKIKEAERKLKIEQDELRKLEK